MLFHALYGMEFRRKRALESPPGLLSLLEIHHNRPKRPLLDLSEPRRILRRFSSTGNSFFVSAKKKNKKKREHSWEESLPNPNRDKGASCRGLEGVSWRRNILFPSELKSSTLAIQPSPSPSSTSTFTSPLPSTLTWRQERENQWEQRQELSQYYPQKEYSDTTRPGLWMLSRPSSPCVMSLTLSKTHSSRAIPLTPSNSLMQTDTNPSSSFVVPLTASNINSSILNEREPSSCVKPLTTSKINLSMPLEGEPSLSGPPSGAMLLTVSKIHSSMQTDTTSSCVAPLVSSNILPSITSSTHNIAPLQEIPAWKELLNRARGRDQTIVSIESKIRLRESLLKNYQETRAALELENLRIKQPSEEKETVAFDRLREEEEEEVHQALNGANRHQVLVQHERSNIDLTRAAIQCLKPGAWLNDDVINLYLELLKERELREPERYMKCHFFNTFFYNKLYKDAHSYDYKSVRRWTTPKKLGYSLLDCEKIFVPIHQDIHWCLAVINVHEKKIQYLDSLGGHDENVLHVLARYLKDEAKDKLNQEFDPSGWKLDCPKDIPVQLNGCDCGMFMIKYADFYSHGNDLRFSQEDMEYFRKKTILELLQLKAR